MLLIRSCALCCGGVAAVATLLLMLRTSIAQLQRSRWASVDAILLRAGEHARSPSGWMRSIGGQQCMHTVTSVCGGVKCALAVPLCPGGCTLNRVV